MFSKVGTKIILASVILFILITGLIIIFINQQMRAQALIEAKAKSIIMLDINLSIHKYFSKQLKPKLFNLIKPIVPDSYFDPICMSSTYAVREINKYFYDANKSSYYYKEAAINARSPENEADDFEKDFLKELNLRPKLVEESKIRIINGKPYFVVIKRGEIMEASCLRCHGDPKNAPEDLIKYYGPTRSFNRKINEVVHAISIRIPLSEAYGNANAFSFKLSVILITLISIFLGILFWLNKRFLLTPLKISEHRYRAMFENMNDCVAVYKAINNGKDFVFVDFNSSAERIDKTKRAELIGKEVREVFPGIEEFGLLKIFERVYMTGISEHHPIRIYKDKRIFGWRENFVYKLSSSEIVAIYRDVTEQKRFEEKLIKSELKLRTIMESMNDPVYISSSDYEITYANPAMVKRVGKSCIGEKCYKNLHDLDEQCPWCKYERVKSGVSTDVEICSPKDGRCYYVASCPINNENGTVSILSILRDITKIKKIEEELLKAKSLESSAILIGGMAHDFNNLLSIILGYFSLAKEMDAKEITHLLNEAEKAVLKAKDLIYQLILIDQQDQGVKKTGCIADLIKNVAENTLKKKSVTYKINVDENLWLIDYNESNMKRAIKNVLTNAEESMQHSGEISIFAENISRIKEERPEILSENEDYIKITICDEGVGIEKAYLLKIFDPYFSTKERGIQKGMGLGLAITHSIIRKHNGFIFVESISGKGTCIYIYLPVSKKGEI
ncbi:MAG: DUF3365 domain-containing protein [Desulfobacterales bacterium]|nr:DUF3365 domain-containing protein [Desulfobacterales bacterium]MBF0398199.1 DUF3365 domain-containing protein [Desulfobacterales bacterium]